MRGAIVLACQVRDQVFAIQRFVDRHRRPGSGQGRRVDIEAHHHFVVNLARGEFGWPLHHEGDADTAFPHVALESP